MRTLSLVADDALTPDQLAAALAGEGRRYHDRHPFHLRMNEGKLNREELHRWVVNRFYYQRSIPMKDAAIISNCPDAAVRRVWLRRIVDHDGTDGNSGGIESWLRLGEALGLPRDVFFGEERVLPGVRFAVDAYVQFCRTHTWVEAVAASLTELFGPDAIRVRLKALREHYPWIEADGLEYFERRLELAPRDAQYARDLVVERCRTREQQERAIAALRFKCDVLWAQLDAIDRGGGVRS